MKPGGGGAKGAQFEREICVGLSLWISDGRSKDLFWRTAMSGGRATVMRKSGELAPNQVGDICAISEEGATLTNDVVFECKRVNTLELPALVFRHSGKLVKFWDTLWSESLFVNKCPVLIARQDRYPTIFAVHRGFRELPVPPMAVIGGKVEASIYLLEHVLKRASPSLFIEYAKDFNREFRDEV